MVVIARDSDLPDDKLRERNSPRCGAEMSTAAFIDLSLFHKLIYCKLCSLR